ncbi:hypothetical protein SAMD00019534_042160 [Acytostelium subglobosum LB1]|uniref:hypothetical protein n=1 Tax=Acytostelium subglobosum LB1 TaxID=1410327 RepID=UPI0006449900|nr:hypothetical protein SAMD00019534_042160 [Acytostelium subglobosum LB1]GAM21041.1 hypothetical protein SAMD00019534_042160 [Acytostelium subglobosum LB1]|eukprot:XP_012756175.1 hypothetical protein SAMD00019534_042160 [Acytostelium subglobosum LB1]
MNNIEIYDDLYKILDVPKDASFRQLSEAYRTQSRLCHPDKGGHTNDFLRLRKAYDILSDPIRRRYYDTTGVTDIRVLDQLKRFTPFATKVSDYVPYFLHNVLDRLFNFKARTMASSIGLATDAPIEDMDFAHIAAFSYVHMWSDYFISKLVDKYMPRKDGTDGPNNKPESSFPFMRQLMVEVLSTLIAAPFEVAAFKAFRYHYKGGSALLDYFTLGADPSAALYKRLLHNVLLYFRTFFSSDLRLVLGLITFRIGYTLTSYFFTSLADYCHHRSLVAKIEHQQKKKEQADQVAQANGQANGQGQQKVDEDEDEQPDLMRDLRKQSLGELAWGVASVLSTAMSYFVPSTMFSIYRLFYRLEAGSGKSYFSPTILVRAGLLQSISSFTLDAIISSYQKGAELFGPK